ncbi:MAG: hypothetical protein J1E98_11650 [Lachnospiraceae bacterium]|nr:hypothetical protein [Lachnospiraceae bacterium]
MYQKEIVYLNLFENDIKNGCVGYLKIEQRQENYYMELQVKNIPNIFAGSFPIRLQCENDWKEADMLAINNGYGRWIGIMSEAVARVEILLTDSHRIKGESKKAQTSEALVSMHTEPVDYMQADEEQKQRSQSEVVIEAKHIDNSQQAIAESSGLNQPRSTTTIIKAEKIVEPIKTTQHSDTPQEPASEAPPLYESKWEQLLATYDQIHPYGDNRIYVKLEPKDFVVLRSNYQHLVNNSFLLHGFYNYRYVILGKEKDFYIGVPGVFYEREKMVALMFGFEAFECEGGDAEEGKFGYYLRKVEI